MLNQRFWCSFLFQLLIFIAKNRPDNEKIYINCFFTFANRTTEGSGSSFFTVFCKTAARTIALSCATPLPADFLIASGVGVLAIGAVLAVISVVSHLLPDQSKQMPSPYGALELVQTQQVV